MHGIIHNKIISFHANCLKKSPSYEPFKPTVLLKSDYVYKYVGVCVCFTEIPLGLQTRHRKSVFALCLLFIIGRGVM